MTDKIREIKKAVLRLMLALAIGVLAGAAGCGAHLSCGDGKRGGCRGTSCSRDGFGR